MANYMEIDGHREPSVCSSGTKAQGKPGGRGSNDKREDEALPAEQSPVPTENTEETRYLVKCGVPTGAQVSYVLSALWVDASWPPPPAAKAST